MLEDGVSLLECLISIIIVSAFGAAVFKLDAHMFKALEISRNRYNTSSMEQSWIVDELNGGNCESLISRTEKIYVKCRKSSGLISIFIIN